MSLSPSKINQLKKIAKGQGGNPAASKLARLFQEAGASLEEESPFGYGLRFNDKSAYIKNVKKKNDRGYSKTVTQDVRIMAKELHKANINAEPSGRG